MTTETTEKKARATRAPRKTVAPTPTEPTVEPKEIEEVAENNQSQDLVVSKKRKTRGIIAVDNGGENTKIFTEDMDNPTFFKSIKKYGRKKDLLADIYPQTDDESLTSYIVEWKDQVYLTNKRTVEASFSITGNTDSKANEYFILSTLIAVAKYGYDINYLSTSVPYKNILNEDELENIREELIGEHTISVDKVEYKFEIADVLVTAEAQAGYFYLEPEGMVTLLEIGSRTVGYATNELVYDEEGNILAESPIDIKSGTIEKAGLAISNIDVDEYIPYCSHIFSELSARKIDEKDEIIAFGGGVLIDGIRDGLQRFFKNITFAEDPLYVQVRGMLILAQLHFKLEEDDEE